MTQIPVILQVKAQAELEKAVAEEIKHQDLPMAEALKHETGNTENDRQSTETSQS